MASVRHLFRLALVVCLCLSTQSLLLVQTAFHLNQEAIAEALCVNKATPETGCHGHCELMRRLHSHQEHEREQGVIALEIALAVAAADLASPALPEPPVRPTSLLGLTEAGAPSDPPLGVWRPPRAEEMRV
ncbi:MAG: hypothetical protein AAF791_05850 [Bacteroidota bacterium]